MVRAILILTAALALFACATPGPAPLLQPDAVRVDVTTSQAALESAVRQALDEEHWRIIRPFDRGVVVAERFHGLGKARIRLRASRGQVVLDYLSSENFDYAVSDRGPIIDTRYNRWVEALMARIRAALSS